MKNINETFNSSRATFFLMVFICCIIGAAVLRITAPVILPIVIAILLTFVMYPIVNFLNKIGCPRFVSILIVVLIIVIGLSAFGMVLFTSGMMIAAQSPQYEERLFLIYYEVARLLQLPFDADLTFIENLWSQLGIRTFILDFTIAFSNSVFRFIASAVLVILFTVFLLVEASFFKEKLEAAFGNRSGRFSKIGRDLMSQVSRYLVAKSGFSLANGIIYAVGFSIIGLEFAILWGILQFFMNYIPTLGSIATSVVISLFALVQFWPEPGPVIAVVAIILTVNTVLSNLLDPKLVGEHVGISPLVVMVSLSFWGFIWGFTGMLLAVPLTVIIKIVCENIPIMEPVSSLLGSRKSVLSKKAERERQEIEARTIPFSGSQ